MWAGWWPTSNMGVRSSPAESPVPGREGRKTIPCGNEYFPSNSHVLCLPMPWPYPVRAAAVQHPLIAAGKPSPTENVSDFSLSVAAALELLRSPETEQLQTVRGKEPQSPETPECSTTSAFLRRCYQDVSLYFFLCKSGEWSCFPPAVVSGCWRRCFLFGSQVEE